MKTIKVDSKNPDLHKEIFQYFDHIEQEDPFLNKNLQLSDQELQIIKKGLSDLIDKQGLTEPQEIYLHNIDSGIQRKVLL